MRNIILLGIVSFLTDVSTEMIYPLIPLFLTSTLGAPPSVLGLIEGMAESTASLLKLFSGIVSDKLKKRRALAIGGYTFSATGKLLLVMATSWWWVLASRLADRFGKGIRTAPRDALIADSAKEGQRGRAFGLHRFLDNAGAVTGILIAYFLLTKYQGNIRVVFWLSLLPAFLAVLFLFPIQEKREKDEPTSQKTKLYFSWRSLDRRLRGFLLITLLFTLGNSSNQFLLLKAKATGIGDKEVILLYLLFNLVAALVSYPAARLSDRIGRRLFLVLGYIFYGLVYTGFAIAAGPGQVILLFALYGLYTGFTEGIEKALVADIAPPEQRATLIGLHAMLVGIGLLPASLLAGWLWDLFGSRAPFLFGGATGFTAGIAMYFLLQPTGLTKKMSGRGVK